jgi:hypothetical protein
MHSQINYNIALEAIIKMVSVVVEFNRDFEYVKPGISFKYNQRNY